MQQLHKELWCDIKDFEGLYEVSNYGRVRSYDKVVNAANNSTRIIKGKIMSLTNSEGGYLKVGLTKNKKVYNKCIHRLVGLHFIENPNNYLELNHIDKNKTNNYYYNLEWCTRKQNNDHSQITQKLNSSKKVKVGQYNKNNELLKIWEGMREAACELGYKNHTGISKCCRGLSKTYKSYIWKYYE